MELATAASAATPDSSFQLNATTQRVVIPASVLGEIASHMVESEGAYVFRIIEYLVHEDALAWIPGVPGLDAYPSQAPFPLSSGCDRD